MTGDIPTIQEYWGNLRLYQDIPANSFGVNRVGLPAGCQVEQVQVLHRHAARYPSSVESIYITQLAAKIASRAAGTHFTGRLSFLNTWSLQTGSDLLIPAGASLAYESGTNFWTRYGRLLYNAAPGQPSYVKTNQTNPLLRCNSLPRVVDTANTWADGFFGPYNSTSKYSLLQIPYTPSQNNTLASFLSCLNYVVPSTSLAKNQPSLVATVPFFLDKAKIRLSRNVPPSINLTEIDAFAMQALCIYEYYTLGSSGFCNLFTIDEWKGFEYVYDSYIYNFASFGSPAGRAIGIGIVQEMIARLNKEYIQSSDSSVNSTLDSSSSTFPLNQKFYLDVTNDFTIVGALAALSLDYFRGPLPATYPRPRHRHFRLSQITPFAGRLITEKIGCVSPHPVARDQPVTQYANNEYGYSASNASYKFIRMVLNNGVLPLNTIRGGACNISGRTDGLCPLDLFIQSQANAVTQANYQFICFGNYTYDSQYFHEDGGYDPPH